MRKVQFGLLVALLSSTAAAEPVTIAALGDSLTQGYGLSPENGFVPQLEAWLRMQGAEIRLINAGVSGDTTAGGASRVDWTLTPDVDGMIVALGGNDILRGIAPDVARANLTKILATAQSAGVEVLLVGVPVPANYGPEYKREFEAIYPELSRSFGTLYAPDFFAGLAGEPADLSGFMQPDGIHPNSEGVRRIVAALGPLVVELADQASR
ncbi:arylesterase [Ruegeria marina]|uniref:Acyl-CoA thioesterase-1 n=1 Tax=Ruegeria marina TaxID=639004 RepID=A0A1G6LYW7_9RHOB|nr:arylesterase [Ruegeria marina]SDC47925.1 acyl-CoA thioesterase-1 [Ruegeria marina]